ncbi:hypothetical protein ACJZ2D_014344 [Fusarium nematophilum]
MFATTVLLLIWLFCRRRRDRKESPYLDDDDMNDYVLEELEATRPTRVGLRRKAMIRLGLRKDMDHAGPSKPAVKRSPSDLDLIIPKDGGSSYQSSPFDDVNAARDLTRSH